MTARRSSFELASVAAALAALAAPAAQAQPTQPPDARGTWMLGIGGQVDDESGQSALGTFNVGVGRSTWLSVAAGRTSSPADRADIEASIVVLGLDQRFEKVGFTLEAERWGDSGVLETDDLAGSVYFDGGGWRLSVGYETRDIAIPFTLTGPLGGTLRRTTDVGAESYSLDARIALGERWQLYVGVAEHDYERDLSVLPRIGALNLLSTSTITLANSFIDHERSIGVERELARSLLNFRFATDRSAIDGSRFESFDAAMLFPLTRRLDLEVNVGRGHSEFFDAGVYGGLLFLVYSR
jgi:hypothetical protein